MAQGLGLAVFLAVAAILRGGLGLHWVPALVSATACAIAAWSEAVIRREGDLAGRLEPLHPYRAVALWIVLGAVVASYGFVPASGAATPGVRALADPVLAARIGLGTLIFGTGLAAYNLAVLAGRVPATQENAGKRAGPGERSG